MTATERLLDALRQHGSKVTGGGRQHMATCPAHEDSSPSLSVTSAETRVLVKCHGGCSVDAVLAALNLTYADLFDEPLPRSDDHRQTVAEYPYVDEAGGLLYQVVRLSPKSFRQRRPDGAGWTWNLNGTRRVLYRLPEVLDAVEAGREVFVGEGEKDADKLAALGLVATCNPGGAGKWRTEYGDCLVGADVVVVADRDEPGMAHAVQVAADLNGRAASVRVVQAVVGKDASDHLAAGYGVEDFEPCDLPADEDALARELNTAAEFARAVERQAYDLRVRESARAKLATEKAAAVEVPPFDAGLLSEVLARPAEPPHRVQDIIPTDAAVLVVAQRKTGKTTLKLNLARSLILGGDFLGRFGVRPIQGRVGFLNFEVSASQLARWADEVGVPHDRFYQVNLRGRRNPFGNDVDRELLAAALREHDVESLIVDPFGRAYVGKSQNDPGEVGAWLADLDRFARGDCGVSDVVLSAHAGWDGERTRGASALEDWADVVVTLVRDRDDDQVRYLRAEGQDVLVDEDRLEYDAATRSLRLLGAGSRKVAAKTRHLDELVPAVTEVVTAAPGITGYKLASALREVDVPFQRGDEIKAARLAVERGLLRFENGPRNSKMYFPTLTYPDLPRPTPTGDVLTYPDLPLLGGGGQQGMSNDDLPRVDKPNESAGCPGCAAKLSDPPPRGCGSPNLHENGVRHGDQPRLV